MNQIHRLEHVENAARALRQRTASIRVVAEPFARRGVNVGRASLGPECIRR